MIRTKNTTTDVNGLGTILDALTAMPTHTLVSGNSSSMNMKIRAHMTAWSWRVPAVPRREERRKGEITPLRRLPTQNPTYATDTDKPGQREVTSSAEIWRNTELYYTGKRITVHCMYTAYTRILCIVVTLCKSMFVHIKLHKSMRRTFYL